MSKERIIKKGFDPRFGMHPSSQSVMRQIVNLIKKPDVDAEDIPKKQGENKPVTNSRRLKIVGGYIDVIELPAEEQQK